MLNFFVWILQNTSWMMKSQNWIQKISGTFFVNVFMYNFYLKTVTTNMPYTTKSSACFAGELVVLASSWNSINTFDITLPKYNFHIKKSYIISGKCHVCGTIFKVKCYIRKHLQKSPNMFWIQSPNFSISDIFYKVQNLKQFIMKAVVPFLPRRLKLNSTIFLGFMLKLIAW